MRRFAMLALSLSLFLGLSGGSLLFAQGEAKKDEVKKDEAKKEVPKKDAPKAEAKKDEAPKEEPLAPIPPEVEKKLAAARRAVAEAIVACQDAGLVKTTIDPPPILDILITGRATDETTLKSKQGVSPEVFGAWFTGYGKSGVNLVPLNDVRIIQPSNGLKAWYDQRASLMTREIDAVRKANGSADAAKKAKDDADKKLKDDAAKNEQMKKDDAAKKDKDAADKKAKDDDAKKEQMKKDDADKKAKDAAAKKEQMKKDDAEKKAKDDADKKAKDDAEKKAKDDADKKAKDDADKKDDDKK